MEAMSGFVKIHRKLFQHPIWKNSTPEQKVILIALIGMANHEPNKWEWKGEEYEVKRGQTITSLDSIREECGKGVTIQNIRTALVRFEKLGFLTNESTKQGRLITICNYCKWQDKHTESNKADNSYLTNDQQTPNNQLTPNKKNKKDKKDKEDIYSDVPAGIKDAFMEWVEMRKKLKKPLESKRAVTMALNKLNALAGNDEAKCELIDYAIFRGWLSFYPIPADDKLPKPKKEEPLPEPIDAVPMPDETRERMQKLGLGNIIGNGGNYGT